MSRQTKRGTRRIVGYVVSLSGKRGGPWAYERLSRFMREEREDAERLAKLIRRHGQHPHARVIPVVRYELDREEERLRDAVVEAAERWAQYQCAPIERHSTKAFSRVHSDLAKSTRALRAHLEKSK